MMDKKKYFIMLEDGRKIYVDVVPLRNKRTVTAVARNCKLLGLQGCNGVFRSIASLEIETGSKLDQDMLMQDSYSARATVCGDDVFDLSVGTEIALRKLKQKLDLAVCNRKYMLAKELVRMARDLDVKNRLLVSGMVGNNDTDVADSLVGINPNGSSGDASWEDEVPF